VCFFVGPFNVGRVIVLPDPPARRFKPHLDLRAVKSWCRQILRGLGKAVQVEPMKPVLKAPGTKRNLCGKRLELSETCVESAWN